MNKEILEKEGKQQLRVFFVFLTTGLVWFVGTAAYFLVHFFPQLGGPWILYYIKIHRYVQMVVDPVLYYMTIPEVRKQVKKKVLCQKFDQAGSSRPTRSNRVGQQVQDQVQIQ